MAQTHFRDICELIGEPYPHKDPGTDTTYCYEMGAEKSGGGDGFAAVLVLALGVGGVVADAGFGVTPGGHAVTGVTGGKGVAPGHGFLCSSRFF